MLVPLGLWVAETDQSSSSEDMSSNSRQSETALERRESPKPEPNSERMEVISCNTSTTVLTVPANSEGATFSNSDPTVLVLVLPSAVRNSTKKKMSVIVSFGVAAIWDNSFFEESAIGKRRTLLCYVTPSGTCVFKERKRAINSTGFRGVHINPSNLMRMEKNQSKKLKIEWMKN